jgi:serine phosphatase RsbU (regulator of sigma subunit)
MFTAYRRKKRDNIEIKLQKEIIENKSKEVEASITYARRIQSAILPSDNFISKVLPRSFVLYQPKDIVSGDFYWVEKVGNKLLIAVVDCTGHGVPGAMVSVVGNNALNRTIKEFKLTEPALILDKLNELVEETFEKSEDDVKDGMDLSLCSFDPDTFELLWAGANNPIWIHNAEGMKEIKGDKQPIGKFIHRKPFTSHKIHLKKGDSFYLFSDGFADQFGGPKGKKFKYKQLMNILIDSKNKKKADQKQILLDALQSWKGNIEQIDDICVIGVEV